MNPNPSQARRVDWSQVGRLNQLLFDSCVRRARESGDAGNYEEALRWCSVAAWSASGQGWCGEVSSRELELELIRAAKQVPIPTAGAKLRSRPRWLHVFSEAYATLGHTNLGRRWVQYDTEVTHDLILLAQKGGAPENLAAAITNSGGRCIVLDPTTNLLQRAAELRNYAWENADVVVLHTHPDEVMAVVAFGVPGGPVVLVENHADHVFWLGCAVADLILEIRRSGQVWTKELRGVDRSTILPIPLEERTGPNRSESIAQEQRRKLRTALGIPEAGIMLLTVGSASKYEAVEGLDFLETAKAILGKCENAYLVAVGPKDEGVWKAAKEATGGRILPLGYQQDSTLFCRSADLYLEGFPLGSLTALLEAGQAGLMCVRAPLGSPLPFCSDSLSLESIQQPKDLDDYVQTAVALVGDVKAREAGGLRLQKEIEAQHCGVGWRRRLEQVKAELPGSHRIHPEFQPKPASELLRDWYLKYTFRNASIPTGLDLAKRILVEAWKRVDGQPKLEAELWVQLKETEGDPKTRGEGAGFGERFRLWRFNRRIQSQGSRHRFLARANVAFRNGKSGLARQMIYRCIWASPSCWGDVFWLKQFVKVHLGTAVVAKLKAIKARRKRQYAN